MKNLKLLRLQRELSQQALADRLDISQQSVYKYENQITEPNIDMLKVMADFFDVSVDYLIGHSSCSHKIEDVQETDLNDDELSLIQKYPPTCYIYFSSIGGHNLSLNLLFQ